jgi:hypothetical protein
MIKFAAKTERVLQSCIALVGFVFLISGLVYLYLGRRTVTQWDFWSIYDYGLSHTWLESALHKYNDHSHFFPSLIWLANLRFFHGNQTLLFLVGSLLHIFAVILLLVPTWRDSTVGLTSRLMATLVVVVASFSMDLGEITESGGFTCCYSLALGGAALAFLYLSELRIDSQQFWTAAVLVVSAAFLATFSFGSGLALWPTFLFLAWCLRLSWRSIALLFVAGVAANIIFVLLPPHIVSRSPIFPSSPFSVALPRLCTILGAPLFVAQSAWPLGRIGASPPESSVFSLGYGSIGLVAAAAVAVVKMIRRDLGKSNLEFTGVALLIFNLVVIALVVTGRAGEFNARPQDIVSSRYMFWSLLVWAGLLIVAIHAAQARQWSRWLLVFAVVAIPVFMFASHYRKGAMRRYSRWQTECGAISLLNDVRDPQIIAPLYRDPKQVYRLAAQLRARRLDMFAEGLQDWIDLSESILFHGRQEREGFKGQCHIEALVHYDDGAPAARVVGRIAGESTLGPKTMVIVDSTGTIRGIARSSGISPFVNSVIYFHRFTPNRFLGYIRHYDAREMYVMRSADNGMLSEETISVPSARASVEKH